MQEGLQTGGPWIHNYKQINNLRTETNPNKRCVLCNKDLEAAWEASAILMHYFHGASGLVVRVPGYRTEMYCVSCEVRTECICYAEESRPPLWSSGQSSWLHIQRSRFDSRQYQTFWEVVGLERGPLSLVSTTEELLGRKSSCSGLESREYGRRDPSRWPRGSLYPQKLALTSPTSGGRTVARIHSRTHDMELFCFLCLTIVYSVRRRQKVFPTSSTKAEDIEHVLPCTLHWSVSCRIRMYSKL
jgi:hypothetical protein